MAKRAFISASESPRKYSEIKAERAESDPHARRRAQTLAEITRLEAEARELQWQAEELRTMLHHDFLVPEKSP